jgi:hypothetical protein
MSDAPRIPRIGPATIRTDSTRWWRVTPLGWMRILIIACTAGVIVALALPVLLLGAGS